MSLQQELEQVSLFKGLSFDQLQDISEFTTRINAVDGDVLISEGDDQHRDLFVLLDGYVEIVSNQSDSLSDEVVLSSDDKEIIGEISWLNGKGRTATVRCHGSADVLRIDGERLNHYLESMPSVGFKVMRQIAMMLALRMEDSNRLLKQILWSKHL